MPSAKQKASLRKAITEAEKLYKAQIKARKFKQKNFRKYVQIIKIICCWTYWKDVMIINFMFKY